MADGILEVLLVSAEGIRRTNLIGRPCYYAIIQCGDQAQRSKTISGYEHEASWNQKFKFLFPLSEWNNLKHLKISIMDEEYFTDGGFVGQTIIHLGGVTTEGKDHGYIDLPPAAYNVVLEDKTFKGEIKIGLTFTVRGQGIVETRNGDMQMKQTNPSIYSIIFRLFNISWWRIFFGYNQNSVDKQKKQ